MFRFTIRDVLWLMVVVGLACGWWMERSQGESRLGTLKLDMAKERAYSRQARATLKTRIEFLEAALTAAGASIPQEQKGATVGKVLDKLNGSGP